MGPILTLSTRHASRYTRWPRCSRPASGIGGGLASPEAKLEAPGAAGGRWRGSVEYARVSVGSCCT